MEVKISAVIITFNEEKNIERCILGLLPIADEIVILDSFSTDSTRAVAEKYGVKFFTHAFDGHIEQKNRVLEYASHDICFSVDADEVPDEKLQKEILKIKQNFNADGYSMNRLTNYCDKWIKHGGWYPDRKLRIWNKNKGKWGGTNPHDEFFMEKDAKIVHLNGNLLHYSYYSIRGHMEQVQKFTDILASAMLKKGKHGSLFKIIFSPFFKFIQSYIMQKGFLDGYFGFVIAIISSHATFLKYIKLRELETKKQF
jgi:glycosyltransferase involved in cell wall biosynthesis